MLLFSPFPISTEIEKILPVKRKATPFMPDGIAFSQQGYTLLDLWCSPSEKRISLWEITWYVLE